MQEACCKAVTSSHSVHDRHLRRGAAEMLPLVVAHKAGFASSTYDAHLDTPALLGYVHCGDTAVSCCCKL